ncbi:hypothetical protein F511_18408, partial [Dorcoceras hygrometricum]
SSELWSAPVFREMQLVAEYEALDRIERMASENAVLVLSISSCCMCLAAKRLFRSMGVNPKVYELDQHPNDHKALMKSLGAVPVVYVGGRLVGSMDVVLVSHINGTLVPLLKQAGALWL